MLFTFNCSAKHPEKKALWSISIVDTFQQTGKSPQQPPTTEDIYIRRCRSSELPIMVDPAHLAQGLAKVIK